MSEPEDRPPVKLVAKDLVVYYGTKKALGPVSMDLPERHVVTQRGLHTERLFQLLTRDGGFLDQELAEPRWDLVASSAPAFAPSLTDKVGSSTRTPPPRGQVL